MFRDHNHFWTIISEHLSENMFIIDITSLQFFKGYELII